ncbi:MAG: DUF6864 domain-containing function [Flavobacterium sp.]
MIKTEIIANIPWKILDSGTVIHYDDSQPITFQIVEDDGTEINIRFEFIGEKGISDEVKLNQYDKDTILIEIRHGMFLTNYGFVKPFKVGTFNGLELLFNFRIDINGSGDSVLMHYTWYTGEEVENEGN